MANELTDEAKRNIENILRKEAFEKANIQQNPAPPVQDENVCAVCECSGGNGMIRMHGTYFPCPTCSTII